MKSRLFASIAVFPTHRACQACQTPQVPAFPAPPQHVIRAGPDIIARIPKGADWASDKARLVGAGIARRRRLPSTGQGKPTIEDECRAISVPQAELRMYENAKRRSVNRFGPPCPLLERPIGRPLEIEKDAGASQCGQGRQVFHDPVIQRMSALSGADGGTGAAPQFIAGIADHHQATGTGEALEDDHVARRVQGKPPA